MTHTANRETFLGYLCSEVSRMKPGEALTVSGVQMRMEIPSFFHNDAHFTPPDRVLGNIVGSAYTHSYSVDMMTGDVTFRRHEDTGQRRYADPDRRERAANGANFMPGCAAECKPENEGKE
jgi:hypothetical protein